MNVTYGNVENIKYQINACSMMQNNFSLKLKIDISKTGLQQCTLAYDAYIR